MPSSQVTCDTVVEKDCCARDVYDDLLIKKRYEQYAGNIPVGAHGTDAQLPSPKSFRKKGCSGFARWLPPQHSPASQSANSQELDQWSRLFIAVTEQGNDQFGFDPKYG